MPMLALMSIGAVLLVIVGPRWINAFWDWEHEYLEFPIGPAIAIGGTIVYFFLLLGVADSVYRANGGRPPASQAETVLSTANVH